MIDNEDEARRQMAEFKKRFQAAGQEAKAAICKASKSSGQVENTALGPASGYAASDIRIHEKYDSPLQRAYEKSLDFARAGINMGAGLNAAAPKSTGEVTELTSKIEQLISDVSQRVTALEFKIGAVLNQPSLLSSGGYAEDGASVNTELGIRLSTNIGKLKLLVSQLDALSNRVAL